MFNYFEKIFSPYVYQNSDNHLTLKEIFQKTKQKWVTLSFMNCYNHNPGWNYSNAYDTTMYDADIEYIRNKGGDIIISFGGAGGNEIATDTSNVDIIYYNYKKVIEKYKLKWIDLDIEGSTLKNQQSNYLRNEALVKLRKDYPDLIISYTLPVSPDGINKDSCNLLKDCYYKGLKIDIVNVMCMDYGTYYAPQPENNMGYYAKLCLKNTKNQLYNLGLVTTNVGCTVMIGQNDVQDEVFNKYDAIYLLKALKEMDYVNYLSFWCINRDNGNGEGKYCSCNWSSIKQSDFEFTTTFQSFTKLKNIAIDKPTTCSTIEKNLPEFNSKYAVDNNLNTRWASQEYKTDKEWIEINLKNETFISQIIINWETAYATSYNIYYTLDNKNYKKIYSTNSNKKLYNKLNFTPFTCKCIRIECIEKATKYGYSIYEIELYNK